MLQARVWILRLVHTRERRVSGLTGRCIINDGQSQGDRVRTTYSSGVKESNELRVVGCSLARSFVFQPQMSKDS